MKKKIIIACDHRGFRLKEKLKPYLEKKGFTIKDLGTYSQEPCDYPYLAYNLARAIAQGRFMRGILICYSGIGNAIVANRVPGVRAALCYKPLAAKLSRQHNDSNVLVLGAYFVNERLAKRILEVWLKTGFLGGRHQRRLKQIKEIEKKIEREGI